MRLNERDVINFTSGQGEWIQLESLGGVMQGHRRDGFVPSADFFVFAQSEMKVVAPILMTEVELKPDPLQGSSENLVTRFWVCDMSFNSIIDSIHWNY